MFSLLVWGCNWILFMHGWFYPIHVIWQKNLHFEIKTRLGRGNSTRWFVGGKSKGSHPKPLLSHCLRVQNVQNYSLTASRFWVSPPPMIVPTTQAAFILEQKDHSYILVTSQNFGAKSQKEPLRQITTKACCDSFALKYGNPKTVTQENVIQET